VATTTVEVVFRLPIWAEWVKALSLPIAAVIGIGIGAFNSWTSHIKRKQDLFDVRLDLYKRIFEQINIQNDIFRDAIYYHNNKGLEGLSEEDSQSFYKSEYIIRWQTIPEIDMVFGQKIASKVNIECLRTPSISREIDDGAVHKILSRKMRLN
jgi:hypothetical protein